MKIVEPSYRIDDMPEGEAALAKIERLGRIAYKSEDRIDPGEKCPGDYDINQTCRLCNGSGWKKEPSSHKFVRMILKAEKKAKTILMARKLMDEKGLDAYLAVNTTYVAARDAYLENLINSIMDYMRENPAHESVIEHCSATVIFTTSRGITHELVRHRLCSFTQESSRYCDYNKGKFGGEISVIERRFDVPHRLAVKRQPEDIWYDAMQAAERYYKELRDYGIPPEIARDVLNNATKADIAVTANFREWNHVFEQRDFSKAHPDMRALMTPLHLEFQKRIPIVFD